MQHENSHVRSRIARRERLPMCPDAEHGIGGSRVVLGYDGDSH
jgi:hypothetical protein